MQEGPLLQGFTVRSVSIGCETESVPIVFELGTDHHFRKTDRMASSFFGALTQGAKFDTKRFQQEIGIFKKQEGACS